MMMMLVRNRKFVEATKSDYSTAENDILGQTLEDFAVASVIAGPVTLNRKAMNKLLCLFVFSSQESRWH